MRQIAALLLALASLAAEPLRVDDVLASVETKYPPYLMALIEQDLAAGRLRRASGAFDLGFVARGGFNPRSYYDGSTGEVQLEQALPFWGADVFAGYRVSSGLLASYDKLRTQEDGELRAGLRFSLLRDGPVDRRRAELWKARFEKEAADPFIQRQRLDVLRASARSYYQWVSAGLRLGVAEELHRVALERDSGLRKQADKGMVAPIVVVDNERLVISRQLGVVQARRRFEAAALELSLFHRSADDAPVVPGRDRLPSAFPVTAPPASSDEKGLADAAAARRPELARIELLRQRTDVDRRLADNDTLPNLDLSVGVTRNLGSGPYADRRTDEASVGVEFRVPVQRNEARGRLQVAEAEIRRLERDAAFTRDRIVNEVRDGLSALRAASEQISQTTRNVELADRLAEAERRRFEQGATDLLALQIREQAAFDARQADLEARADFFRAMADYRAALGETSGY